MQVKKQVELTKNGCELLFFSMCCWQLTEMGFNGDVWKTVQDFDLSAEEVIDKPLEQWPDLIRKDAEDFRRDCPELFHKKH